MVSRQNIPSIQGLLALQATAACGSISAAAEELRLTQSAVSRQVKALEIFLGVALFSRDQNRMQLTERGIIYLEEVTPLLENLAAATASVNGSRRNAATINVATLATFGSKWLMPRLKGFQTANPDISINVVTRSNLFDFAMEHIDVAIFFGVAAWPGTKPTFLMKEVVAAVATPEVAEALISADLLARAPLVQVASRPFAWREWFETLDAGTIRYRPSLTVETFSMAIEAVLAGFGVGLFPTFLIEDELQSGKLVKVLGITRPSSESYWLVTPETKRTWPTVRKFSAWLTQSASAPAEQG